MESVIDIIDLLQSVVEWIWEEVEKANVWQADRWTDEVKEPCHLFQTGMDLSLVCVSVSVCVRARVLVLEK